MKKREGSALMFTMIIMVVGIILTMSMFSLIKSDLVRTSKFKDRYYDVYIAESAVNAFEFYLTTNDADFRSRYEDASKNLTFTLEFEDANETCEINVYEVTDSTDQYYKFMRAEITVGTLTTYYLMKDKGSSYEFIKYIDKYW